jgi:hypothetical protein
MSTATITVMWFRKKLAKSGREPSAPRQIPSNGGLTDLDAELEEFDAPKRVVEAHLTDQVAYFGARLGPSGTV